MMQKPENHVIYYFQTIHWAVWNVINTFPPNLLHWNWKFHNFSSISTRHSCISSLDMAIKKAFFIRWPFMPRIEVFSEQKSETLRIEREKKVSLERIFFIGVSSCVLKNFNIKLEFFKHFSVSAAGKKLQKLFSFSLTQTDRRGNKKTFKLCTRLAVKKSRNRKWPFCCLPNEWEKLKELLKLTSSKS